MRSNAGTKTLTCPTPADWSLSDSYEKCVSSVFRTGRDWRRQGKLIMNYLLHCCCCCCWFFVLLMQVSPEKCEECVCGIVIVLPATTCSTHSFQLNISHLKPVKSCSFILLNPTLHDRTSLGASPGSGVVWCGVVWCVVRGLGTKYRASRL